MQGRARIGLIGFPERCGVMRGVQPLPQHYRGTGSARHHSLAKRACELQNDVCEPVLLVIVEQAQTKRSTDYICTKPKQPIL
jgi:hypothetical protein